MKNLIDELHALNDDNFEVSASFSQDIMKQIKRDNAIKKFIKVSSALSCACAVVICAFLIIKIGGKDIINNATKNTSGEVNVVEQVEYAKSSSIDNTYEISQTTEMAEDTSVEGASLRVESINQNATMSKAKSPATGISYDNYVDGNVEESKEIVPTETSNYESELLFDDLKEIENKKYSRVYNKSDYLAEISKTLSSKGIDNKIINDTEIEVNNSDINLIYNVIENFVDVAVELKDDGIIIKLNN